MEILDSDRTIPSRSIAGRVRDVPMTGPVAALSPAASFLGVLGSILWVWSWIAPRPENAARLTGLTAFLLGALAPIGGSTLTVWSILGASWSLLYLLGVRPRPQFSRAQLLLAGVYFFFALTTLVSGVFRKDPWFGFLRAVNDWPFLYSLLSMSVLASLGPVDVRRPLARGAAVGSILGFSIGAFKFFFLDTAIYRPSGGTGNSAIYGQASLILAFLSMLCFARESQLWRRISVAGLLCGLAAVVVSGSRASAVAAVALVPAVTWLLWKSQEWTTLRRAGIIGVLSIAAAIVTFPAWKNSSPAQRFRNLANRLDQADDKEVVGESIDQRVIQIRAAWKALWRRPWLGYGMQHRMKAAAKLEPPQYASAFRHTHIHFLYLDYAIGNGVIGLVSLVLLLAAPIGLAWLPGDDFFAERLYGASVLSFGFGILGLAGASLGMDIGNTMFACFGTMLVIPATRTSAQAAAADLEPQRNAAPLRRAA